MASCCCREGAGDRQFWSASSATLSDPAADGGEERADRSDVRGGVPDRGGVLGARLGTEFLPKLEEGNLWIRAVMPPTITLEAGMEAVAAVRKTIMEFAPVQTVVSEQGRGDDATDPDGSFLAEFFVPLKPQSEWPKGLTKVQLVDQMNAKLNSQFIGIDFNFSQYIQDNIEEAVSGVKGENSIKLFGPDLGELERISKSLKAELAKVPGVVNPAASTSSASPISWCGSTAPRRRATASRSATSTRSFRPRSAARR